MRTLLALTVACCLCGWVRAETIAVAAAISLKDALEEVSRRYENERGEHVEFNFGSSGQLMTQIRRGAPVDLFISAAAKQMDELSGAGLVDPATRAVIASNELVLVVPRGHADAASFSALRDARFKRISIGEPESVPAGQYAMQVLEKLGIIDAVRQRLVYGANVRQVLSYVERGEVEAGIVYRTDALVSGDKVHVVATAERDWHAPIEYPAAVVSASAKRDAARRFLDYLRSEPAQATLKAHGFAGAAPATQPGR